MHCKICNAPNATKVKINKLGGHPIFVYLCFKHRKGFNDFRKNPK